MTKSDGAHGATPKDRLIDSTPAGVELHDVGPERFSAWVRAVETGFLRPPTTAMVEYFEPILRRPGNRLLGAFDGQRCVATFRSFPKEITVPGGGVLDADAISAVTVTATHRRQGLLSRMMTRELAAAVDRGQALAILIAAEWPIYGRFGFGPASRYSDVEVDTTRAALRPDAPDVDAGGRVDLVDSDELASEAAALYERLRPLYPGLLDRPDYWWEEAVGRRVHPRKPYRPSFHALYRDADGVTTGAVVYRVEDTDQWPRGIPHARLVVDGLFAADPAARAALWRYCLSVDWVRTVTAGRRPPDEPLPLLLTDGRAAYHTEDVDHLWLRILDVPTALAGRDYAAAGRLVLQVHDALGHADGRFLLESGKHGSRCMPTDEAPDVALSASALGALYLGGESAQRMRSAGTLTEESSGGAWRCDALFHTGWRPWTPDGF